MQVFLQVLSQFRGNEVGAKELAKISGFDDRFCRFFLIKSGAKRMRIGQAFFYRVPEILLYLKGQLGYAP